MKRRKKSFYEKHVKRGLDLIISFSALFVLFPFLLVVIVLIKLDSKGPVFFIQERPGLNKKIFKIYKFRTMVQGAVKYQKVGVQVTRDDARITTIGTFLRRYKIDELAQLINVIKGDMSIVGPRPTLPEYLQEYEKWELRKFRVRPGLTGLAQINGSIYLDRRDRSKYDVKYAQNVSFFLDMKIIIKTFSIVLYGEEKFIKRVGTK